MDLDKFIVWKILTKRFDANKVIISDIGKTIYLFRTSLNNGVRGYINEDEQYLNEWKHYSFGQDTTMFYQEKLLFYWW